MYHVFTCVPGESYHRPLESLLLRFCGLFRALTVVVVVVLLLLLLVLVVLVATDLFVLFVCLLTKPYSFIYCCGLFIDLFTLMSFVSSDCQRISISCICFVLSLFFFFFFFY